MKTLTGIATSFVNSFYPKHYYSCHSFDGLYDRPIRVHAQDSGIDVVFTLYADRIVLAPYSDQLIALSISASTSDFIYAFFLNRYKDTHITLQGAAELAPMLHAFVHSLNLDWHGLLHATLGPALSYVLLSKSSKLRAFCAKTSRQCAESAGVYLQQEAAISPSAADLKHFYDEVDDMSATIEALTARLDHLAGES